MSRQALAVILFLFEPFLAATLLLRIGSTLVERDALTWAALLVRVALALLSVAAAISLRDARTGSDRFATVVLASSAAFAIVQYFTRALPTSLPPDLAGVVTIAVVVHHAAWMAWLSLRH